MAPRGTIEGILHRLRLRRIELAQLIDDIAGWCEASDVPLIENLPSLKTLQVELEELTDQLERTRP